MRTIKRTIVAAVVMSSDGLLLLGLQNATGAYPGCWAIPGGGVETGESLEEALRREVMEECGLDIRGAAITLLELEDSAVAQKRLPSGEVILADMTFKVYRVQLPEQALDVKLDRGDEFEELRWYAPAKAVTLNLPPPSKKLFSFLGFY